MSATASRVNLQEISVRISSSRASCSSIPSAAMVTTWSARARRRISIHGGPGS
jgi:hypothetical protein